MSKEAINILLEEFPDLTEAIEEEYEKLKLEILVRNMRNHAKLSQAELAKRIGTKQSVIARIEGNKSNNMNIQTLIKVATATGYKIDIVAQPVT
ncbi:MAG: helix-turn-helix transcriptional regulator [bacterium]